MAQSAAHSLSLPAPLLRVEDLVVRFPRRQGAIQPVDGVSLEVRPGEVVGVVGESGSGKSLTALALMGLIPPPGQVHAKRLELEGTSLLELPTRDHRRYLGRDLAMIFQDPATSLNPSFTVGFQLDEVLRLHRGGPARSRRAAALELLQSVGIPDPPKRLSAYPHQLSGGMAQRVMIAMALAGEPRLLIADEPTTALDVTIQAQIVALLGRISSERGMALVLISHDLALISETADRIYVMYAGQIVEEGPAEALLTAPRHPYSAALLASHPDPQRDRRGEPLPTLAGVVPPLDDLPAGCRLQPRCPKAGPRCSAEEPRLTRSLDRAVRCHFPVNLAEKLALLLSELPARHPPVLAADGLSKSYRVPTGIGRSQSLHALSEVSFSLDNGKTLAVVGESGSGKSTLARLLVGMENPSDGELWFDGQQIPAGDRQLQRSLRRQVRMIFQDPYGSLNPRARIRDLLEEPLRHFTNLNGRERCAKVVETLERVGLHGDAARRYPHMFSGGQRQRIAIARALILSPRVIVADEPVSALDVSIQSQILNLLLALQQDLDLAYVFISHDLGVVRHVADELMVMYLGRAVEQGPADVIFARPLHPYTKILLNSTPKLGAGKRRPGDQPSGDLPSPLDPPPGCAFHRRCPLADGRCAVERPLTRELDGRWVACHHAHFNAPLPALAAEDRD